MLCLLSQAVLVTVIKIEYEHVWYVKNIDMTMISANLKNIDFLSNIMQNKTEKSENFRIGFIPSCKKGNT